MACVLQQVVVWSYKEYIEDAQRQLVGPTYHEVSHSRLKECNNANEENDRSLGLNYALTPNTINRYATAEAIRTMVKMTINNCATNESKTSNIPQANNLGQMLFERYVCCEPCKISSNQTNELFQKLQFI
ncbi:hypothetical protein GJ496_011746 [Pomphorhynchus laevis]|nr:hypothetical protein GJ496_011746 [Pomphorhynchus laevis]